MTSSVQPNMVVDDQLAYFDHRTLSCTLINIDTGETFLLYDLDESKLSDYRIDRIINVTESGVVFSAQKFSDSNYVIAKIGLDNVVTIQKNTEGIVTVFVPLSGVE